MILSKNAKIDELDKKSINDALFDIMVKDQAEKMKKKKEANAEKLSKKSLNDALYGLMKKKIVVKKDNVKNSNRCY